jgi:putative toxin-antitoxin system antitoxin component (TIGR02293 family)
MARVTSKEIPLHDNLRMAEMVAAGLPTQALREISGSLGIQMSRVGPLVNIAPKTLQRRLQAGGRLKPAESERVVRLMRLVARAHAVLGDEAKTRAWLERPLRELGGKTALELSATEPGAREVEQVLGRLEHGVFA